MQTTTRPRQRRRRSSPLKWMIYAVFFIIGIVMLYQFISLLMTGIQGEAADSGTSVPAGQRSAPPAAPQELDGYTAISPSAEDLQLGMLTLVNNSHPYSFPNGVDLQSIYEFKSSHYSVRSTEILLQKDVIDKLTTMVDAFSSETGFNTINVVAGYRTYEDQEHLYTASMEKNGEAHTVKYYANPGSSEHHTGLAVDFALFYPSTGMSGEFTGSKEAQWFEENSWKYGFVKRYDDAKFEFTGIADEPWHFRYVGLPHAFIMKEKNFCLEEYIDYLRNFEFSGEHLTAEYGGQKYEIYYCGKDFVYVPSNALYTISGNNTDGFIVTAAVS